MAKLALGTVQLGLPYGISNAAGQVSEASASTILSSALELGIDLFDTARDYGSSESVIGGFFHKNPAAKSSAKTVTKLRLEPNVDIRSKIPELVRDSLTKLHCDRVYGVLLHREEDLAHPQNGKSVWAALEKLAKQGLIEKIGVSAYTPEVLKRLLSEYPIGMIQVPYHLLDERFFDDELIQLYQKQKTEVHIRSVFLQGFYFLNESNCPEKMRFSLPILKELQAVSKKLGDGKTEISPAVFSLLAALKHPSISRVVVGVTSVSELKEIQKWSRQSLDHVLTEELRVRIAALREAASPRLIDPRLW